MLLDTKANLRQENERLKYINHSLGKDLRAAYDEIAELTDAKHKLRIVVEALAQNSDTIRLQDDLDRLECELDCAEGREENLHERIRSLERQRSSVDLRPIRLGRDIGAEIRATGDGPL